MLNLKYKRDRQWLLFWLLLIAVISLGIMSNNKQGDFYDNFVPSFIVIYLSLYLPFFIIRTIFVWVNTWGSDRGNIKDGYSKKFDEKIRTKQILSDIETYRYGGNYLLWDERRTKKKRKKLKDELSSLKKKYKSKVTKITEKARKKEKARSIPLTKEELEKKIKSEEKGAERREARLRGFEHGKFAIKVKCPHCHETGHVRRKVEKHTEETREKGIVGSVIGRKTITDKGNITKFFCENCNTPWTA